MYYQNRIASILAEINRTDVTPRHVEGWMRSETPTLDGLSAAAFRSEVVTAVASIDETAGTTMSEDLAGSFGL